MVIIIIIGVTIAVALACCNFCTLQYHETIYSLVTLVTNDKKLDIRKEVFAFVLARKIFGFLL